jgi:hypothetical protein
MTSPFVDARPGGPTSAAVDDHHKKAADRRQHVIGHIGAT